MKNIFKILIIITVGLILGGCPKHNHSKYRTVVISAPKVEIKEAKPIPGEEFFYNQKHELSLPFKKLNKKYIRPLKRIAVIDYDKKYKKYYVAMSDKITSMKYDLKRSTKKKQTLVIKATHTTFTLLKFKMSYFDSINLEPEDYKFYTTDKYMKTYRKSQHKLNKYKKIDPYVMNLYTGNIERKDKCLLLWHSSDSYEFDNPGRVPIFILIPHNINEDIDLYAIKRYCQIRRTEYSRSHNFNFIDEDNVNHILSKKPQSPKYKPATTEDKMRNLNHKVESLQDQIKRLKFQLEHKN